MLHKIVLESHHQVAYRKSASLPVYYNSSIVVRIIFSSPSKHTKQEHNSKINHHSLQNASKTQKFYMLRFKKQSKKNNTTKLKFLYKYYCLFFFKF